MSKYIHKYTPWWKGGGGGGSYDDTAIKRRLTALESGKQNVLVGGDGIILLNDTISAVNILNDTRESSTTVWSSTKVKSLFETLQGQVDIVITPNKPSKSSAVNKTMYYVGTTSPYHIWFFVNDEYTDFGTTELDLSNYFTKAEINELLELKVDKVVGKSLVLDTDIAQITTNKTDIANIKDDENLTSFSKVKLEFDNKQDTITDSTLSDLSDSTTISSVSASGKTNKTFALSKLWEYIRGKISSSTGRGINVSSNVIGHSNSEITAKTNTNICGLKYDNYGHVTAKGTDYSVSDTYASTADNQLFTRKGANALYNNVVKLGGVFYRNGTQSVSIASWTNVSLTNTESGDTSIAELSSNGVKIKTTGEYKFTITLRIPDTTSTLQWGVGITGSDDDLRGGSWNYTHTRHKVTTVIVKPISANTVIYPKINIIAGASSINYCQMTVEKLK